MFRKDQGSCLWACHVTVGLCWYNCFWVIHVFVLKFIDSLHRSRWNDFFVMPRLIVAWSNLYNSSQKLSICYLIGYVIEDKCICFCIESLSPWNASSIRFFLIDDICSFIYLHIGWHFIIHNHLLWSSPKQSGGHISWGFWSSNIIGMLQV